MTIWARSGWPRWLDSAPARLSGGQAQRVAIARALAQRPQVLLADEPVASLDPEAAEEIMRLLRRLATDEHLAVLCVLHQVELAYAYADRVVGIRDGRDRLRSAARRGVARCGAPALSQRGRVSLDAAAPQLAERSWAEAGQPGAAARAARSALRGNRCAGG